ncbi:MAG: hypothetical protein BWX72_01724 [Firmicutes bacterium ADurb.Bin080]|nr:MAG: hypothetical protein BWX72_01724 [Firmicutes bacterium ADurb.Bin080]
MKTKKWIILLIAAILTVIIAITVVGCNPEDTGNPDDPNNPLDQPKNVTALKANLLAMSGYSEEITVEGANYDFRDQAISLSMINNFCTNVSLSAMSQAKIDALATKDFQAMEGPQDLLSLDLTEDDFVILATAMYAAGVTTYNNASLFDAAETAAQAYIASVPAETKAIFEEYAEYYAVVEALQRGYELDQNTTQADIDAGIALLATVDLVGDPEIVGVQGRGLRDQLENGIINVAEQAMWDAIDEINDLADPIRSAAQEKEGALAINENSYTFGTFANWARLISENQQTVDASTLLWLANWLDGVKEIAPDTTITIPTSVDGLTSEWMASVEREIKNIRTDLQRIAQDYEDYARIAFQAQGMEILPEESFLFSSGIQARLQALMPELPVFTYRAINTMFGDEVVELISGEFEGLGDLGGTELVAMIDSLKTNLSELSDFVVDNESDLLLLKAEFAAMAANDTYRFIKSQLLVGTEIIDAMVNLVPSAEVFIQGLVEPLNATNISGIFDSLDAELDVEVQMNAGIYLAKVADALLTKYPESADFADDLCELIFDHSSDHLHLQFLESVQGIFVDLLPEESEDITEDMILNYEHYVSLKETMIQFEMISVPETIEGYYNQLQEELDGEVGTTITDFADATQVGNYIIAVNAYMDNLINDDEDGVIVTMRTLISKSLAQTVYATLDAEIIGALADCVAVTEKEDYSEDEDYLALADAMTDFLNIFIGMGMFNEEDYEMPLIGEPGGLTVEELFGSFMEGLMEGMMGENNFDEYETLLTPSDPFEFIGDQENAQWFKIVATDTGETQISVAIENSAWWGDFEFLSPDGEEFYNWYGGDIYLNLYAGMTYYISFYADDAGTLSMSEIEATSYSLPD